MSFSRSLASLGGRGRRAGSGTRSCAALFAGALLLSTAHAGDLNPGSLLVYPLVDSRPGIITLLTVTNSAEAASGNVFVEFDYVDGQDCSESRTIEALAPADTLTVSVQAHVAPGIHGYAFVYAVSDSSQLRKPIVKNDLVGISSVIDGLTTRVHSVNPKPFLGIGDGTETDLDGDGVRDLDGIEYSRAPDRLVLPRFFGQSSEVSSDLVLVNLTGGPQFDATVNFVIFNDNEFAFSAQYTFSCWAQQSLLGISSVFDNLFLALATNNEPIEILGHAVQESGWIHIDGQSAVNGSIVIQNPAILACFVETFGTFVPDAVASLPFSLGLQANGDLLERDPCVATDNLEPDDDCASAFSFPPSSSENVPGLSVTRTNEDWYSFSVPPLHTLTVQALFAHASGDIDMSIVDTCGGTILDTGMSTTDNEQVTFANTTGVPQTCLVRVFVPPASVQDCNAYRLEVDVSPNNLIAFCFGDGSGTPCPCGNNSSLGHLGGCAHQDGEGARLVGTGTPSLAADSLHFDLSSAVHDSFAVLLSGLNRLPQTGCVGCGLQSFDGLRCAGGSLRRHGSRTTNSSGQAGNGWGPPAGPPGGLGLSSSAIAGQTRHYFSFVRTDLGATCFTGQNSSNGVSVTWAP